MSEETTSHEAGNDVAKYLLLGSFLGALAGTTIAVFALSESSEEKKAQLNELQKELLKPVKVKLLEAVDQVVDNFKTALDEASQTTSEKATPIDEG